MRLHLVQAQEYCLGGDAGDEEIEMVVAPAGGSGVGWGVVPEVPAGVI